jgi:hypothetical protein
MRVLAALVRKELRAVFTSPIAYAVIAVFIVLSGYTFVVSMIVSKQATLVHIFFQSAVQLILLVPLITMRQFAEERRSGTIELLLTSPIREIDIVLAKFVACMVVLLAMTGLTLVYAAVLAAYSEPDFAVPPRSREPHRAAVAVPQVAEEVGRSGLHVVEQVSLLVGGERCALVLQRECQVVLRHVSGPRSVGVQHDHARPPSAHGSLLVLRHRRKASRNAAGRLMSGQVRRLIS